MRECCRYYEMMRQHLHTLTPATPTPEQKVAVEALAEMINDEDNRHMEASLD